MKKKHRKKQYNIKNIENASFEDDDTLILHIPVNSNFLKKSNTVKSITQLTESEEDLNELLLNKENSFISVIEKNETHKLKYDILNTRININNKTFEHPSETEEHCWWCRNDFENNPIYLPIKYENNIFYCTGCFCSFNCCKAYLFDNYKYDVWKLNSILNTYYTKLTKRVDDIKISCSWKMLKQYGGTMTIKEFRNNFTNNEYYHLNDLNIFVHGDIVEKVIDIKNDKKYHEKKGYKLKRTKSLIKRNNNLSAIVDLL